ncbi:PepSY-associated TM helix domain-containing protein [Rugamonas sp. CCM 8940]|uniref:PepSY-associated TM helix domain-containing protein n=1 Tax=Rugamonas sp. CCM 8940 TaxID=2765359 RepID=UPI0018F55BEF|nr:PepSY-associated TM helix domain-containing protein [Rugamonas sp. CCM 8940]MBJ7311722.1 PepSY domain-containing protein [Rugamonas sp. CCM 8940]
MNSHSSHSNSNSHSNSHSKLRHARRRSLFWRIHLWAALIASPFALIATLTGILYIFTPQIEAALYRNIDHVTPNGAVLPLDIAVAAARAAAPAGLSVLAVLPPYQADDAVRVTLAPQGQARGEHDAHQPSQQPATPPTPPNAQHRHAATATATAQELAPMAIAEAPAKPASGSPSGSLVVHVDPYTGTVLGTLASADRFGHWSKKLHSHLLQGDGWRWMIELAASWMLVMLLTGVYLWWPRGAQKALPQTGAAGRNFWRQWHGFLGVALGLMSLPILLTGLTWSKYAGEQVRVLRDAAGQASPQPPRELRSGPANGAVALDWQAAWNAARRHAPDVALQLTPPRTPQHPWRVGAAERGQPDKRFDLLLDAYNAQTLYYSGWQRQTAFGKATSIGIPFHRGEFGWWNQALLLVFGLSVLFSLVSGWLMYFKRRAPGTLGLPKLLPGAWRAVTPGLWLSALALCALMPLLAVSAALVLLCESILWRRLRA